MRDLTPFGFWQPQTGAGFPAMNALGQMEAYTLGGSLDVERLHDAATGAVTSITSGPNGSGTVLNLTSSYNANGSRLTLNDLQEGLDQTFTYTDLQQLKTVTRTSSSGNSSSSFSYGAAGQFQQGPAGSYSYGSFPAHSPSSTTKNGVTTDYSYDLDGDRTAARLPQVTWDALGKARSITPSVGATPIDLTYGPDGGLINNSDTYGGRYLGEWLKWQDNNNWSARIVMQGRVIAVVKNTGGSVSTRYLLRGPLGSTQAVANGSGNLLQRIAYGAWGSFVEPNTGAGSVPPSSIAAYTTVTYTGHELIAGANMINMGARLYDPATGLFMSPDPTVAHPYDTQDLNQYAYVGDNSMTFIDQNGLCEHPPGGVCLPTMVTGICANGLFGDYPNCYSVDEWLEKTLGAGIRGYNAGSYGGPDVSNTLANALVNSAKKIDCNIKYITLIDQFLKNHGSPLTGQGANFVNAGAKYNLDPRLTVALAGAETGFGKNITWGAYNAWNWGWNRPRSDSPFTSWASGINSVTKGIGGPGSYYSVRTPAFDAAVKFYDSYCSGGGCVNGLDNLTWFLLQLGGSVNQLKFPCDKV